jgi:hypothetical protein
MTTVYKVLGQVTSTAAATSAVDNLIIDTFDAWASPNITSGSSIGSSSSSVRVGTTNTSTNALISGPSPFIVSSSASSSASWNVSNSGKTDQLGARALRWNHNAINSSTLLSIGRSPGNPTSNKTDNLDAIPVLPNTTYYLGYSMAWDTPAARSHTSTVFRLNSSFGLINQSQLTSTTLGTTSSFARTTLSFSTSPDTRYVAFQWSFSNDTTNIYTCWIDGVSLSTNTNSWSTYNDPNLDSTTYPGNRTLLNPFSDRILGFEGTPSLSRTVRTFAGAPVNLYTVPSGGQTVCSTLTISNPNTSSTNYRVAVLPEGETLNIKHFIAFDHTIAANATTALTFGLTLKAGDSILVSSDSGNVGFSVFGSESI